RDRLVPDRLVDLALALRALSRSTEERGAQAIRDVGAVLRPVVRSRARLHRAARRRRLPLARRPGAYPVASPHPFSDPSRVAAGPGGPPARPLGHRAPAARRPG